MPELKELKTKRTTIKSRLTKFNNYVQLVSVISSLNPIQINELNLKLEKIKNLSTQYENVQDQIDILSSESETTLGVELEERDKIESLFDSLMSKAQTIIEKSMEFKDAQASSISNSETQHTIGFKLPNLQINRFNGQYSTWLEFRELYKSLIHDNERLQSIHKFHYLNCYLEGEAAQVVANLEVTAANYSKAWELLNERYDNKRQLIKNHLNALLDIGAIHQESVDTLRCLVDCINKNLRALASLGEPTDKWDTIIIHLISVKLDGTTHRKWEEQRNTLGDKSSSLPHFLEFLKNRADVLESCQVTNQVSQLSSRASSSFVKATRTSGSNNKSYSFITQQESGKSDSYSCYFCGRNHSIYSCPQFLALLPEQRLVETNKLRLCVNCLRKGHMARACRSGCCRQCKKRHNSLLHFKSALPPSQSPAGKKPLPAMVKFTESEAAAAEPLASPALSCTASSPPSRSLQCAAPATECQVMLSTALIKVQNPSTQIVETVRCLLDSGSTSTFITKDLQEKLNLKTLPIYREVLGIGNIKSHAINETSVVQLLSLQSPFAVTLAVNVLPQLTGSIPRTTINTKTMQFPANIQLADPNFFEPAPIEVLIGADIFWEIIGTERMSLGKQQPTLISSQLGWLVTGPFFQQSIQCNFTVSMDQYENQLSMEKLDKGLTRFWELEELPKRPLLSDSEKACEKFFEETTTRLETGQFCVRLPLKDSPDRLGDSYRLAKRRLESLEKRFRKNPELKNLYSEFISEYKQLGHLSWIGEVSAPKCSSPRTHYLSHHAVLRDHSESTRLRVVFDAFAPTTSGVALNDIQYVGPQVQDSLFAILLRFRQHTFVITGDVEKLFRQVILHEDDRNLQLILWRENEDGPMITLKLNTVTYGFASSPYLAKKCLWLLGEECSDNNIKTIIQRDMYCDDLITGASSKSEVLYILNSVTAALKKGCFNLRKFRSNVPAIFQQSSSINLQGNLMLSSSASALGLGWNPNSDNLQFTVEMPANNASEAVTKRFILASTFKIFDPLGLLSPSTVQPKMLMQQLWLRKLDWDEPIPEDLKKEWFRIQTSLPSLSSIKLSRRTICDNPVSLELHTFCDASKLAYGACAYLRSTDEQGNTHVNLLCAKSRVAPTKPALTIPRLELLGALLASNLSKTVLEALRCSIDRSVQWCDSKVVLAWLNSSPSRLKSFVGNKVVEICENTHLDSWRHVPTTCNPADYISRGISADKLQHLDTWWHGPTFLRHDESQWPPSTAETDETQIKNLPEVEVYLAEHLPEEEVLPVEVEESIVQFNRFSKFSRLKRTFAFVFRFNYNARNPQSKCTGPLSAKELERSFVFLARQSQLQSFPKEVIALIKKRNIPVKSKILSLTPFLDETGVMRVGGRLDSSSYSYDIKHPIILDSAHHLSKLYYQYEHIRHLHCGATMLLCAVRTRLWVIAGRRLARSTVRRCTVCSRHAARTVAPLMGNLPVQRVSSAFPYQTVSMDFAGPFTIITRKGRGARTAKCYLCLFVCFRFKCLHLEAVSDLSMQAFILAFRRFIARRGKPLEVFSDNGRNFVAAAKEIGKFIKNNMAQLSDFAANEEITFKFHPAYAPHFSGLAEAGIKSAKHLLKRVIGNTNFTFEEISTLFTQVEATLNSRPLYPMSSDPHDFLTLTPGHFIIGRPITSLPAPSMEGRSDPVSRYAKLEKTRQQFWHRWQREYISELQQRLKWKQNMSSLQVNDLVLIQEDNIPPLNWRLGRIEKLIPGPDNICRVADIRTARGTIRRALTRLCPLLKSEPEIV